jgi:hypothetical protein
MAPSVVGGAARVPAPVIPVTGWAFLEARDREAGDAESIGRARKVGSGRTASRSRTFTPRTGTCAMSQISGSGVRGRERMPCASACRSGSDGAMSRLDRAGLTRRNLDGLVTPPWGPAGLWLPELAAQARLGRRWTSGSAFFEQRRLDFGPGAVFRRLAWAAERGPSLSRVTNSPARGTWSVAARKAGPRNS